MKQYSGFDRLPKGRAKENITSGCLVLEGGAFRGVYISGVLDYLMEHDINFECVIGTSAGALIGANYVARQIGRCARVNLGYRHEHGYVGLSAYRNNKGLIGFDFLFHGLDSKDPFDFEEMKKTKRRFLAVTCCVNNGKTAYFENKKCSDIYKAIQASASMPYISRPVRIDDKYYLDGGVTCKVAYLWALQQGFDKIVVVRTREVGYRKEIKESSRKRALRFYSKDPEFAKSRSMSEASANSDYEKTEELSKEGRIFMIAPSHHLDISRLEGDREKLGAGYQLGYQDMKKNFEGLLSYLQE